jgi:predicted nuclease of restriction endonuclease-like (RecB) superfamily
MRQFFETYRGQPKLSALLRELSWTNNLMILGKSKREEEREFYLRLAAAQKWTSRELERQINNALFERTVLSPAKLSAPLRELHPAAEAVFKDAYLVEFLDLPPEHSEADLQRGLVEQLKRFLIELGRDFCFIGSQYGVPIVTEKKTTIFTVTGVHRASGAGVDGCGSARPRPRSGICHTG